MNLNVDIKVVSKSIDEAKNIFNGKAIERAQEDLKVFAQGAEKQVNELDAKIRMMSTETLKLRAEGQMAVEELNNAKAKIQYQETQIANAQKINKTLSEANQKLEKKSTKVDTFTRTLENGNTEITKQKGRVTVIEEKSPNGNFVTREVNLIDKSNRKTVYNPVSGKPEITTTNTNGQVSMAYDLEGKNAIISNSAEPKAIMVKQYRNDNNQVVQEFSDGSIIKIFEDPSKNIHTVKIDKNNIKNEVLIESTKGNKVHNVFNKNQTISELFLERKQVTKTIVVNQFGDKIVSEYKVVTPIYTAVYRPTGTDSLGRINQAEWRIKYNTGKVFDGRYTIRATEGYVQLGINPKTNELEPLESVLRCEDGRYSVSKNKLYDQNNPFYTEYFDAEGKPVKPNTFVDWNPFDRMIGYEPMEIERDEKWTRINIEPFSEGHIRY